MKHALLTGLFTTFLLLNAKANLYVSPTNPTCADSCNGSAYVFGGGGGAINYHYNWSTGDTLPTVHNLCDGTYWVIIYDSAFNQLDSLNFTINEPYPLTYHAYAISGACGAGGHNGYIQSTGANGGTWPHSFLWNDGSNAPGVYNVGAGTYSVTVTDHNGCTVSATYVINEIIVTSAVTNTSSCGACDGGITLTATDSTLSYDWSSPFLGGGPVISNVCAGSYTCTVSNNLGCFLQVTSNVATPSNGLTATLAHTGVYCTGTDTTTLIVSSGVAPYRVYWGNGAYSDWGGPVFANSYGWHGSYVINVIDTTGCSFFLYDTIADLSVTVAIVLDSTPTCANPQSGLLGAHAAGGNLPYTYVWSNGGTTSAINSLVDQDYSVTVTNNFGCTASANFDSTYLAPYFLHVYGASSPCAYGGVGSAHIVATGGTPPYAYLWNTTPGKQGHGPRVFPRAIIALL
jgi:hypothetical protein